MFVCLGEPESTVYNLGIAEATTTDTTICPPIFFPGQLFITAANEPNTVYIIQPSVLPTDSEGACIMDTGEDAATPAGDAPTHAVVGEAEVPDQEKLDVIVEQLLDKDSVCTLEHCMLEYCAKWDWYYVSTVPCNRYKNSSYFDICSRS